MGDIFTQHATLPAFAQMVNFWSQKLENAEWVFTQRLYHWTIFAVSDIFRAVSTLAPLNLASAEVIWFCWVLRVTVSNLGQRSFKEHSVSMPFPHSCGDKCMLQMSTSFPSLHSNIIMHSSVITRGRKDTCYLLTECNFLISAVLLDTFVYLWLFTSHFNPTLITSFQSQNIFLILGRAIWSMKNEI